MRDATPQGGSGSHGFTLLEVLVALAILSLVMLALVRTVAQEAESLRYLRERSFAEWVASNALAELRLSGNLSPGRRAGESEFASRRYRWQVLVQDTPVAGIRRIDVVVQGSDESEPLAQLTGFAGR